MRLTIKQDGKVLGVWVAKTSRGFNKKQRADILKVRRDSGLLRKECPKVATKSSNCATL